MDAQVEVLWSTGMSAAEIAQQLGVTLAYVLEALCRLGVDQ